MSNKREPIEVDDADLYIESTENHGQHIGIMCERGKTPEDGRLFSFAINFKKFREHGDALENVILLASSYLAQWKNPSAFPREVTTPNFMHAGMQAGGQA